MKETVISFLDMLQEVTLEGQKNANNEYQKGVKDTIRYARSWFKSNGIKEFEVKEMY